MKYRKLVKVVLSVLVVVTVSFFFYSEFRKNWVIIHSYDLKIEMFFVLLSFAAIVMTYLLTTYGWFLTINSLSDQKISFLESIATVNTSNLTKYIPGKVWSYAFQMYWLVNAGFSKSLILYVNLINLYVSLITALILGLGYLVFSPRIFPFTFTITLLVTLIVFELWFITFHSTIFKKVILVLNRIFRRDIGYYETSKKLICYLHLIYFLAAFCFGMGAYFLCFGIGLDVDRSKMFLVMSSMMIAEVIGFVAIIAPGGLGVREGLMYLILNGVSIAALSLILPIATRFVSMFVDIFLGTIGFMLLKKL